MSPPAGPEQEADRAGQSTGARPDDDPRPADDPAAAAVVIVNHNTREDLLGCLASLCDAGAVQTVVVDSGSSDGSLEAVAREFPQVTRIGLRNVGFGSAANAGVAATTAPTVVVANADTRFPPGSVAALGRAMAERPQVGVIGPLIRFPDGRLQLSARAFPTLGQAIGHAVLGLWRPHNRWTRAYRLTDWDHASEREVDWLSGGCLAVRRQAFDQIGGFDPAYFMFVEDVDLCFRMAEAGWQVRFVPVTEVVHAVGGAVSRRRFRMVVEHARSLDRFFGRRYGRGVGRLLRPVIRIGLTGWVLTTITWSALRGRTHGQG